jgi:transposase
VKTKYTLELKMEATAGQRWHAVSVTAKVLGIPKASLDNWVKLSAKGYLKGAEDKPVISTEQMELARFRAQLARVTMERPTRHPAPHFSGEPRHPPAGQGDRHLR